MTVAAVVLVPDLEVALSDADGEPAIRRLCQAAWAGGAMPIVLVVPAESPPLAAALADLPVTVASAAAEGAPGVAWFVFGLHSAVAAVTETSAGLMWPLRYAWVDPETVTSLIEAHGAAADNILRPAYRSQPGFPILVPAAFETRLGALRGRHGEEAVASLIADGVPQRSIELGDPGITHDIATPRAGLPGYQGPPEPAAGPPPDWNADLAAQAERSAESAR
ncbi:MAG: NTP transferase domain-containing protein [Candidatus Limnocylindrales bacterium]